MKVVEQDPIALFVYALKAPETRRKYVVEYAMMLAENLAFYDGDALVSFLDDVVRYMGRKKDYEQFTNCRERI